MRVLFSEDGNKQDWPFCDSRSSANFGHSLEFTWENSDDISDHPAVIHVVNGKL